MDGVKSGVRILERNSAIRAGSPLLALNNAHAEALTELSPSEWRRLLDQAFLVLFAGEGDAFLVALDGAPIPAARISFGSAVASPVSSMSIGWSWRPTRAGADWGARFTKPDRARRRGRPRTDRQRGNSDPPNPGSDAFHAAMGFAVIGAATLSNGESVRYYARTLGGGGKSPPRASQASINSRRRLRPAARFCLSKPCAATMERPASTGCSASPIACSARAQMTGPAALSKSRTNSATNLPSGWRRRCASAATAKKSPPPIDLSAASATSAFEQVRSTSRSFTLVFSSLPPQLGLPSLDGGSLRFFRIPGAQQLWILT